MKERLESFEYLIRGYLGFHQDNINEYTIRETVEKYRVMVPELTDEEITKLIKRFETIYTVTMDTGITLTNEDTYKEWYHSNFSEREQGYWNRYRKYLLQTKKLPIEVVNKMNEITDEIMSNLGDPYADYSFSRKGLVIGAVQSGKTANYIALMNKAADSGYKVIILLTGTIEKLRRQTQIRVDEGFTGNVSKAKSQDNKIIEIGVGEIDNSLTATSLTTTSNDFEMGEAIKLNAVNGTVVFVVKKNKSVLEKLYSWLKMRNNTNSRGKLEEHQLLLIDDEADNASINTNSPEKDPTTINRNIRKILSLFEKSSYIGFTATPFANIFIDPQLNDSNFQEFDDLFPKDFITILSQPSNYIGPNEMYSIDGEYRYMLNNNDDVENVLPIKHKNGSHFPRLPKTLEDALYLFFIANAIRDIRGDTTEHRSMLIHISRFISVQNNVKEKIDIFVYELKQAIKNYIFFPEENKHIIRLKQVFEKEYKQKNNVIETWGQIQKVLYKSISPIQVKVINSREANKDLNYDDYPDGLRLIAIGGLSLARGLTLEGLMVSYFYRNTRMYDTLMQMGRWFGYRDNYKDLCRLWISSESAEWYEHIANATEELKLEISKMKYDNKKPIEFGLKVKSANDTPLIITARNKMRSTETIKLRRSISGQMVETPLLYKNENNINENREVVERWLFENSQYNYNRSDLALNKPTLKNVPKDNIYDLLENLQFPYSNNFDYMLKDEEINQSKILDYWDVIIGSANNGEEDYTLGPFNVKPVLRKFDFFGDNILRINKSKKRLGSVGNAKGGLTKDEFESIEQIVKQQRINAGLNKQGKLKGASDNMYFETGIKRNPLLVIYPIILQKNENDQEINNYVDSIRFPLIGVSMGIPAIDNIKNIVHDYEINAVMQKELLGLIDISENEDYDEDNDE